MQKECPIRHKAPVFIISLDTEIAWGWAEKKVNPVQKKTNAKDVRKTIPPSWRFRRAKKRINSAMRRKSIFHIYLHPHVIAWKRNEPLRRRLEDIILYVANLRDKGMFPIMSMKVLTQEIMRKQAQA